MELTKWNPKSYQIILYGIQMVLNITYAYHIVQFAFLFVFLAFLLYFHYLFQTLIILLKVVTICFCLCYQTYSMIQLFLIFSFIFTLLSLCFLFNNYFTFQLAYFAIRLPKNLSLIEGFIFSCFMNLIELSFIHFQNLLLYIIPILIFVHLKIIINLLFLSNYLP